MSKTKKEPKKEKAAEKFTFTKKQYNFLKEEIETLFDELQDLSSRLYKLEYKKFTNLFDFLNRFKFGR